MEPPGKLRVLRIDVESPDHAGVPEMTYPWVGRQPGCGGIQARGLHAVGCDDVFRVEDIERRKCGPACERVSGIGVRVQKSPGRRIVIECLVDRVACEYYRKRKVSARQSFRQAQEIRRDAGALVREKRTGAP